MSLYNRALGRFKMNTCGFKMNTYEIDKEISKLALWLRNYNFGEDTSIIRIEGLCDKCKKKKDCLIEERSISFVPEKCPFLTEHLVLQGNKTLVSLKNLVTRIKRKHNESWDIMVNNKT